MGCSESTRFPSSFILIQPCTTGNLLGREPRGVIPKTKTTAECLEVTTHTQSVNLLLTSSRFQTILPTNRVASPFPERSLRSVEELRTQKTTTTTCVKDDVWLIVSSPLSVPSNAPLHSKNTVGLVITEWDKKKLYPDG